MFLSINNSNTINVICIVIFIIAVGVAAAIRIYQYYKKSGETFDFKEFINKYGDQIIAILKDVVKFLKESESNYSSKEEYEEAIIALTMKEIKENYNEIGIDTSVLSIISTESMASIIYDILHGNSIDIFSVLDATDITNNKILYDDEVVTSIEKIK